MYQVIQITNLTPTHISVLLSDDVAYDVDRGAFEEYVTDGTGIYSYALPDTGYEYLRTKDMPMAEYWEEFKTNNTQHIADINDYISQSKSTQLDIDVVRAKSDCDQMIESHLDLVNGLVMKTFVKAYATAIKNQITYQKQ